MLRVKPIIRPVVTAAVLYMSAVAVTCGNDKPCTVECRASPRVMVEKWLVSRSRGNDVSFAYDTSTGAGRAIADLHQTMAELNGRRNRLIEDIQEKLGKKAVDEVTNRLKWSARRSDADWEGYFANELEIFIREDGLAASAFMPSK